MKLAMTPRFYDGGIDQFIAIEKKYYPFFEKFNCNIHLVPFLGIKAEDYLEENKPDAVVFAGGYRLYTDEIKTFETNFMRATVKKKYQYWPFVVVCGQ